MKPSIQHSRPWITARDIEAVKQTLSKKYISHLCVSNHLAELLREYSDFKQCYLFGSGTLALRSALMGLKLRRGSAIGMPSFTCHDLLTGTIAAGYKPFILDCDSTGMLDCAAVSKAIDKKLIDACIVVHQFGRIHRSIQFAAKHIPIIEDCSHVPPRQYIARSKMIFGSLEGTKLIGAGEGGYLLSMNCLSGANTLDTTTLLLGNRLSDTISVLAICQLLRLGQNIKKRESIAQKYIYALKTNTPGDNFKAAWFRFLIRMDSKQNVDTLIQIAQRENITLKRPIMPHPLHRYLKEFNTACPNADINWEKTISIPLYPALSPAEIHRVSDFLKNHFGRINKAPAILL